MSTSPSLRKNGIPVNEYYQDALPSNALHTPFTADYRLTAASRMSYRVRCASFRHQVCGAFSRAPLYLCPCLSVQEVRIEDICKLMFVRLRKTGHVKIRSVRVSQTGLYFILTAVSDTRSMKFGPPNAPRSLSGAKQNKGRLFVVLLTRLCKDVSHDLSLPRNQEQDRRAVPLPFR